MTVEMTMTPTVGMEQLRGERLVLEVGTRVSESRRTDWEAACYVTSGYGILYVGVWAYPIEAGHAIWIPAGTEYSLENTGAEPLGVVRFGCSTVVGRR
jgi:mannose-6-phosphate isomerase-like protein (cupin superfamily)